MAESQEQETTIVRCGKCAGKEEMCTGCKQQKARLEKIRKKVKTAQKKNNFRFGI